MGMNKQFKLYSVDTKAFYTPEEIQLNGEKLEIKKQMDEYEKWEIFKITNSSDISHENFQIKSNRIHELKKIEERSLEEDDELKSLKELFKKPKKIKSTNKEYKTSQELKKAKELSQVKIRNIAKENLSSNEEYKKLKNMFKEKNKLFSEELSVSEKMRYLNPKSLNLYNQITLFDNSLSRTMGVEADEMVLDLIVVRAYHYSILEELIKNGFEYIDKETGEIKTYRVFTASAGQIRTKKVIFIEEKEWKKYERTLMCGLTIDDINNSREKGCNINKFLAYLALCNSATDEIQGFDIDRCIVIEDFESIVEGEVDYIDNKTFEVTRKTMGVSIPHSDGCGWVLKGKKNFMIRLPWVKGLMTPTNYIKFCEEYREGDFSIVDIYGKSWDLKSDNIHYVFTKSQFKMWKYYENDIDQNGNILEHGWEKYKRYFKEFNCKGNMCNLEPSTKEFRKASFNYQMWQTLTDITDDEIAEFTDGVDEFITKGYSDRKTMLEILGATSDNPMKTNLQKCLEIYPELIRDYHVKEELASSLNSKKKEAKYGKFKINAHYTFLIPDVFAWMENVFLKIEKPDGLLKDGEVSCKLFKDSLELLVNRSPHLYKEHAVRKQVLNEYTKKWFVTDGNYTSSHDLISKILQFDNDGDKGLIIAEKSLIEIAKRNMKGIVPLYYEMGKAKAMKITFENIYDSLTKAFKFNNIGKFSNQLTVMWNLDNPNLTTIAQITALNNFTIDGAKTLLVPEVPKNILSDMKDSNGKLPYFFRFAKDKDISDVANMNDSVVNRICRNIENIKQENYSFNNIGKFKRNMLMNNPRIKINYSVVECYKELDKYKNLCFANAKSKGISKEDAYPAIFKEVKNKFKICFEEFGLTEIESVDIIIQYIYKENKNCKKGILFDLFGDIIFNNLKNNIKEPLDNGYIMCDKCGERVKLNGNNSRFCGKCSKELIKERDRLRKKVLISTF